MCESGAGEDVAHLLVKVWFFLIGICVLADEVSRIVWAGEWLEEWKIVQEGKVALLLGKGVEGVCDIVMEEMGVCIVYWIGKWWQRKHPSECRFVAFFVLAVSVL